MSAAAAAGAAPATGSSGDEPSTARVGWMKARRLELRALPFATLLFTQVGAHGLLETARDSLYLRTEPVTRLPWVYLAVIAVVLLVVPLQSRLSRRWPGPMSLAVTLILSGVLTVGLWLFASQPAAVNALYVWAALFSSLVFAQFWLNVDEVYNVGEAKRVFGFIAGAGLLGAACGAGVARFALGFGPPSMLLLISAGLMLAGGTVVAILAGAVHRCQHPVQADVTVLRAVPRETMPDPYLRLLMLLTVVTAVAATLVDYLFKASISAHVAPERLPMVIADTYVAQTVVALAVELVAVRYVLGSTGVTRSLAVFPVTLLGAVAGFLAGSPLAFGIGLKILDGGLRPSLQRVGSELLFIPVPPARRRLLKPSIDVLGQRGGQLVAALFLLAVQALIGAPALVAVAIALTALGSLWVTRALRPRYLDLFRGQLSQRSLSLGGTAKLDLASAETLALALGSVDSREVLAAMSLLAHHGRLGLVPALILHHPDPAVVRAALEHFGTVSRRDVDAFLPRLLQHPDEQVRTIAVQRWLAAGRTPEDLQAASRDPSPLVRAAALVALSSLPTGAEARARTRTVARGGSLDERRALARAIADAPRPDLLDLLQQLFDPGDVETRRETVRAAKRLPDPRFVPELVSLLADADLRGVAREALVATADPALERLSELLLSEDTAFAVAREIPATLLRFAPEQGAPVLLRRLASGRGGLVRFRSLRTLNQLRRQQRGLPLDRAAVETALSLDLRKAFRDRALRRGLERFGVAQSEPAGLLLAELLEEKESLATERVFRALQLFLREERVEAVYRAVKSGRSELHAAAVELLQGLLPRQWRAPVLALVVENQPGPEPYRAPWTPEQLEQPAIYIGALLEHTSQMVRGMAAQFAAERGWAEAVPALATAARSAAGDGAELFSAALTRLGHQELARA